MGDLIKEQEIRLYDVLLTHRKAYNLSPESWLLAPGIRFFTDSYYNHADIVVEVLGEKWVCGAIAGGFMPHTPLHKWLAEYPKKREFAVLRRKGFEPAVVRHRILAIGGAKYDWNATLGDGFLDALNQKLFGSKKYKWSQKRANEQKVNCSEAIDYAFEEDESYKSTPKDIFENKRYSIIFETRYLTDGK